MDPISNVDRLVLVLRQRLVERTRASSTGGKAKHSAPANTAPAGLDAVRALAAIDEVDDQQLGRALIQSILTDQFGPELINQAKFQLAVDRVVDGLKQDPNLASLLDRVILELRQAAL